jgi:ribosome-associated protein YbcJ (S4-like RNA binding protein)
MKVFTLKKEFITLVQYLKVEGYISSGGEAKVFIESHHIELNNKKVIEKKKKIFAENILTIDKESITFKHD